MSDNELRDAAQFAIETFLQRRAEKASCDSCTLQDNGLKRTIKPVDIPYPAKVMHFQVYWRDDEHFKDQDGLLVQVIYNNETGQLSVSEVNAIDGDRRICSLAGVSDGVLNGYFKKYVKEKENGNG